MAPPDVSLWQPVVVSGGSAENTDLLRYHDDILVYMGEHVVYDDQLIFAARITKGISGYYSECHVWRTDGPPETLKPILGGKCNNHRGGPTYHPAVFKERLFIGYADRFGYKSVFQSDGTKEGTKQIAEFGHTWYNLRDMIVADERLYLLMEQRLLAYEIVQ